MKEYWLGNWGRDFPKMEWPGSIPIPFPSRYDDIEGLICGPEGPPRPRYDEKFLDSLE